MEVRRNGMEIAIIGMSCRYPQSPDVARFWENIINGTECIKFLDSNEIDKVDPDKKMRQTGNYVAAGTCIEDIEFFDAEFFGISPREAEITEPQHKVFLECASEALESSGYDSTRFNRLIGCYGGANMSTYILNLINNENYSNIDGVQVEISNDKDYLTSRVAYKLGLKGPAVTVQSACSTSLVAIHYACRALLGGECDMALAGGICIRTPQINGYIYQESGMFSPDGHCRPFDEQASGTVFGNGAGIVVLKRLEDAEKDKDHIYAIIKGSAINNDGAEKVGYTAPCVDGQTAVIQSALEFAEVDARSIGYIEAHGTATMLGDPIEFEGLSKAFRYTTNDKNFCALGSIKANMGHLSSASGVAGVMKVALLLGKKIIPPQINFKHINPNIDLDNSPFYINTLAKQWDTSNEILRRASVSSFGVGGTNAHIVLEEYAAKDEKKKPAEAYPFIVSARTVKALKDYKKKYLKYINENDVDDLEKLCYTACMGRRELNVRYATVVGDSKDLLLNLDRYESEYHQLKSESPSVVLLFPGQGKQVLGVGRQLYNRFPAIKKIVDECLLLIQKHTSFNYQQFLMEKSDYKYDLDVLSTAFLQPWIFTIEYAVAKFLLMSGLKPSIMMGHSLGEYTAAALTGVFSLKDAVKIVVMRGQYMQEMESGKMISVNRPESVVQKYLKDDLAISAINTPSSCVVSGNEKSVNEAEQVMLQEGFTIKKIQTTHAFHTPMMNTAAKKLRNLLKDIKINNPDSAIISTLTGKPVSMGEMNKPDYWVNHMTNKVQFSSGIQHLLSESKRIYIEAGPGNMLISLLKQNAKKQSQINAYSVFNRKSNDESQSLLETMCKLWCMNTGINFNLCFSKDVYRMPLPTYPFQKKRYWVSSKHISNNVKRQLRDIDSFLYEPVWKQCDKAVTLNAIENVLFISLQNNNNPLLNELGCQGISIIQVINAPQMEVKSNKLICTDLHSEKGISELIKYISDIYPEYLDNIICDFTYGTEQKNVNIEAQNDSYLFTLPMIVNNLPKVKSKITMLLDGKYSCKDADIDLNYEQALTEGSRLVISQEYKHISVRTVVKDPSASDSVDLVIKALNQSETAYLAISNEKIYEKEYRAFRADKKWSVKKNGVFLIIGGLGGIGKEIALWLTRKAKVHLILIGRTPLPEKSEWETMEIGGNNQSKVSRKIKAIQEIEMLGSSVEYISADVSNREDVLASIAKISKTNQHINYIFHCAGEYNATEIKYSDNKSLGKAISAKKGGLEFVERLQKVVKLDSIILFSSLIATIGGIGNYSYCSANALLDAYALYCRKKHKINAMSINWDGWLDTGMEQRRTQEWKNKTENNHSTMINDKIGLYTEESLALLEKILALDKPQVVISVRELHSYISKISSIQNQKEKTIYERPMLNTEYVKAKTTRQQAIVNIYTDTLGIKQIGIEDDYFDLGGDSLMAIQIITKLKDEFLIDVPLNTFFNYLTIKEIDEYLETQIQSNK